MTKEYIRLISRVRKGKNSKREIATASTSFTDYFKQNIL